VPELWIYDGEVVVITRHNPDEIHRRGGVEITYVHRSRREIISKKQLRDHGELLMRGDEK